MPRTSQKSACFDPHVITGVVVAPSSEMPPDPSANYNSERESPYANPTESPGVSPLCLFTGTLASS